MFVLMDAGHVSLDPLVSAEQRLREGCRLMEELLGNAGNNIGENSVQIDTRRRK